MDVEINNNWDSKDETSYSFPLDHDPDAVDDDDALDHDEPRFADEPEADDEPETDNAPTAVEASARAEDTPAESKPKAKVIDPLFPDVFAWVDKFFIKVIRRRINPEAGEGLAWDPRWWLYPEVVARLAALHGAWEEARASDKPSAMSSWWIHHFEPHIRVLLDGETGPMALAKDDGSWSGFPQMGNHPVPPTMRETILSPVNADTQTAN